jgi:hydrogenase expression/formation protein HypD
MLVRQLEQGRAEVENQYVRSVTREGNTAARQRMFEVFEIGDRKWRGIGESRLGIPPAPGVCRLRCRTPVQRPGHVS